MHSRELFDPRRRNPSWLPSGSPRTPQLSTTPATALAASKKSFRALAPSAGCRSGRAITNGPIRSMAARQGTTVRCFRRS